MKYRLDWRYFEAQKTKKRIKSKLKEVGEFVLVLVIFLGIMALGGLADAPHTLPY